MKKKNLAAALIATSLFYPSIAYAEEVAVEGVEISEPIEELPEDPRQYPNEDTLPPPDEELISEDPWANSSLDPEPNNSQIIPSSQDEPEVWAIVDENGNTLNTIVCDIDYCGSGWIPTEYNGNSVIGWSRVVLQSKRNQDTGDYGAGHYGQYNFPSETWILQKDDGGTYVVPKEYGSASYCIKECPDPIVYIPIQENDSSSNTLGSNFTTENYYELSDTQERSVAVEILTTKKSFSFYHKVSPKKKIRGGKVWVIATKNNKKMVWKFAVNKNRRVKIVLPLNYLEWNITLNYKLKNKFAKEINRVSKSIVPTP